jgi:ribonuclease E
MSSDDVFAAYRIDEQLAKALERKVWLPSGGSLIIDRTEAMTVIDVNTGKFTGQGGNLEETVTRNNLEAAEEIVRQLRLRDVGGIVVIDFIDMVLESNRDLVLRRLLECLARDRTKHQVAEVTSLGLVQMTRKRVGAGLLEAFSEPCEHCNGRGVIVHLEVSEPGAHHAPRRGAGNGAGTAASGNGSAGHNGRRELIVEPGAALAGTADPGSGAAGHAAARGTGQPERGGRRNRRDRDRGRQGATAVAHAIADMASATLSPSDTDVVSVETPAAIDETMIAGTVADRSATGARQGRADRSAASEATSVAGTEPSGAAGTVVPVADVPPAAPGRRTRAGSASVRRVTTSDEPVAVVVTVPPAAEPVVAEPAPAVAEPASVVAEPAVAEPASADVTPADLEPPVEPDAVADVVPAVADMAPAELEAAAEVAAMAEAVPATPGAAPTMAEPSAEGIPVADEVTAVSAPVPLEAEPTVAAAPEVEAVPEVTDLGPAVVEPTVQAAPEADALPLADDFGPTAAEAAPDVADLGPAVVELVTDTDAGAPAAPEPGAETEPAGGAEPDGESEPVSAAVAELPAGDDAAAAGGDAAGGDAAGGDAAGGDAAGDDAAGTAQPQEQRDDSGEETGFLFGG